MVSDHWEQITERVVRQIRRDASFLELGNLPESDLRERSREILQNLGSWLVSKEDDIARRYERLGRRRYSEGVPLHELVHAIQIIKDCMTQYVRDESLAQTPIDIYAEEELQHGADRIFNAMVYYMVRGYEQAMRERAMTAA